MSLDDSIQNFGGQNLAAAILRTRAQIPQPIRMNLKAKSNAIVCVSLTIASSRQKGGDNMIAAGERMTCANRIWLSGETPSGQTMRANGQLLKPRFKNIEVKIGCFCWSDQVLNTPHPCFKRISLHSKQPSQLCYFANSWTRWFGTNIRYYRYVDLNTPCEFHSNPSFAKVCVTVRN
jgi:hypothetical protein